MDFEFFIKFILNHINRISNIRTQSYGFQYCHYCLHCQKAESV